MKPNQGDYVVLVHGLGRTSLSMKKPERFLAQKGYTVVNFSYPSIRFDIETLANQYLKQALLEHCIDPSRKIHFLTHSLGGILARTYLKNEVIHSLGRVVMLAPPNQGSELADFLKELTLYQWLLGSAGQQLGTDSASLPIQLGRVNFELGIIAGDKNINPFSSFIFISANDGKVSVDRAKVEGMKDFLIVRRSHTFLMNDKDVLEQACFFFQNGCFETIR
ncbi:MAG: alpha/beta fold hydrolase [Myxacorys chilensis ATA2-1-KO14]|jgi:pimeloyl-ACP methyl ester carboxylesterase|nr:alpha/beta fold hydrolase [Myxacorys chilensis ATA2-1-KO14]